MTTPYQTRLSALFGDHGVGTLVTLKSDGRPQLSNVLYAYDAAAHRFRVSITATRAKTANIRRDPRVSLHVSGEGGWSYAVAEGVAELSPPAADPHDPTAEALVLLYRRLSGEHPDWEEFRAAMVRERRLLLTVTVKRFYGLTD